MNIEHLLDKVATEGGHIVSDDACSEMEIGVAKLSGRFAMQDDKGFVWRSPQWLRRNEPLCPEDPEVAKLPLQKQFLIAEFSQQVDRMSHAQAQEMCRYVHRTLICERQILPEVKSYLSGL